MSKWIYDGYTKVHDDSRKHMIEKWCYHCSDCGFIIPWYYGYEDINFIYKYHACPSCMTRMEGTDNETD